MIESDEDSNDFAAAYPATAQVMPPAKKTRAAATNRVTKATRAKPTPTSNVVTEKTMNATEKSTQGRGRKRPAGEDVQEPEDQDTEDKPKSGRGRPRATKAQKLAEAEEEDELSELHLETVAPPPVKRGRKPKMNVEIEIPETQQPEMEIPETQPVDMVEVNMEEEEGDERIEELPTFNRQVISSVQRQQSSRVLFSASRGAVSASDSELSDPSLRRRIGELTRKCESLEAKYRNLHEIGVQEAERNFDGLRKQSEERANSK